MNYFHNKIIELENELPVKNSDWISILWEAWRKWNKTDQVPYLKLRPVEILEVTNLIKSMGKSH